MRSRTLIGSGRFDGVDASVHHLTVQVLPVADVLEVTARVLPAQLGLRPVGLQPGVVVPAVLGAGGHAAGGGVPHGAGRLWLYSKEAVSSSLLQSVPGRKERGVPPLPAVQPRAAAAPRLRFQHSPRPPRCFRPVKASGYLHIDIFTRWSTEQT